MRYLVRFIASISIAWMSHSSLYSETISAVILINSKIDNAYTINEEGTKIMEPTWQAVCAALGLPVTDVPGGEFCLTIPSGNALYVQSGDLCADGSFRIPMNFGWCKEFRVACPNSTWTLSDDKKTCSRPDLSCIINVDAVSEEKLLAAIAYAEASTKDSFEEMAAIANAVMRRKKAAGEASVLALVKRYPNFIYAIIDGNPRFRKLMCSETRASFKKAYHAAENAIFDRIDYSNGGCFWDGYDLKNNTKHDKYLRGGFRFTNPAHNIFFTQEPPHIVITTSKGSYTHVYESTAAHGGTIFWKLNGDFLKAKGTRQCI